MSEEEDLLGGSKPDPHAQLQASRPPRGRPPKPKPAPEEKSDLKLTGALQGVTVYWLAQVFGMTTESVRMRLADCTPESVHGKSNRYRVKDAAPYLVDPKIDIEKYMKRMRAGDLPPLLQKEIWDAKLKRQKWEAQAGDLWHTEDVIAVLSEVFATIKSTVQLWPDTVERTVGLEDDQRELLVSMGDTLQDEVYRKLQEMAQEKSTKSSIANLEDEPEEDEELTEEDLL